MESNILKPYVYITNSKGKNIRSMFIDVLLSWYNVLPDDSEKIKEIVNSIHNSSLLIDDIQDKSKLRRGKECAHYVYGVNLTLNAGYLKIFSLLECQKDFETIQLIIKCINNLHIGQGIDIYRSEISFPIVPSMEEYLNMIDLKTGSLFYLIHDLIQKKSNIATNYRIVKLIQLFSRYFQIKDDFINLFDKKYQEKKGILCEDLEQNKFTYPIILCINNKYKDYEQLLKMLKKAKEDKITNNDKIYICNILKENGTYENTKKYLETIKKNICNVIIRLPYNKLILQILKMI